MGAPNNEYLQNRAIMYYLQRHRENPCYRALLPVDPRGSFASTVASGRSALQQWGHFYVPNDSRPN